MFLVKPSSTLLGVSVIGNNDDREVLVEAISNLVGIYVEGYEGANNRAAEMLNAIVNAPLTEEQFEVRFPWLDICFLAFMLEDYKWMIDNKNDFYITSDPVMQPVYDSCKKGRRKYVALVSYFQECVWEALESVVGEVVIRGFRNLVRKAVPNYNHYYPQALDFMNKSLFDTPIEERSGMLNNLVRSLIKKDNGYDDLVSVVDQFAKDNDLKYNEVSFRGNEIDLYSLW